MTVGRQVAAGLVLAWIFETRSLMSQRAGSTPGMASARPAALFRTPRTRAPSRGPLEEQTTLSARSLTKRSGDLRSLSPALSGVCLMSNPSVSIAVATQPLLEAPTATVA